MDVANTLVEKIFSFVALLKKCADKLDKLANELEENKKNVNVTKVVGSTVSVSGAAAMTLAGVATLFTGGAALPVIAAGGAIASWVGLATNVTTDVVDAIVSSSTLKEAEEVSNKIKNLHAKMEKLVESLKKEVQRRAEDNGSCGDVMEYILRAMAERNGLKLHDSVSLKNIMSYVFKDVMSVEALFHHTLLSIGLSVLSQAARGAGKLVAERVGGKAAGKAAGQAAGKAVGRIAGGAVGLVFSVPELIENCKSLDCCQTDASKNLRENAESIRADSKAMQRELEKIETIFRRLARVKHCIENPLRSRADREFLIEFVQEQCKDQEQSEVIQKWLIENVESQVLFQLVDMFNCIREKIDEEKKKRRRRKRPVRITFVAHGEIDSAYMIPAGCLMPLSSITDVVLYSPWNCYITADAAYGIATGLIRLKDRIFFCADEECCRHFQKNHRPDVLPVRWNSMQREHRVIPNIKVSPMNPPEDDAYIRFKFLEETHGAPGPDYVTVLYLPPGPHCVPFYIITQVLSLVLFFCDYEASLHLAACLGDTCTSTRYMYNKNCLKLQYAYTIDNTGMTIRSDKFPIRDPELYWALKALFGSTYPRR